MEYWRKSRSPYRGTFGEIVKIAEYEHSGKCIEAVLEVLMDPGKKLSSLDFSEGGGYHKWQLFQSDNSKKRMK